MSENNSQSPPPKVGSIEYYQQEVVTINSKIAGIDNKITEIDNKITEIDNKIIGGNITQFADEEYKTKVKQIDDQIKIKLEAINKAEASLLNSTESNKEVYTKVLDCSIKMNACDDIRKYELAEDIPHRLELLEILKLYLDLDYLNKEIKKELESVKDMKKSVKDMKKSVKDMKKSLKHDKECIERDKETLRQEKQKYLDIIREMEKEANASEKLGDNEQRESAKRVENVPLTAVQANFSNHLKENLCYMKVDNSKLLNGKVNSLIETQYKIDLEVLKKHALIDYKNTEIANMIGKFSEIHQLIEMLVHNVKELSDENASWSKTYKMVKEDEVLSKLYNDLIENFRNYVPEFLQRPTDSSKPPYYKLCLKFSAFLDACIIKIFPDLELTVYVPELEVTFDHKIFEKRWNEVMLFIEKVLHDEWKKCFQTDLRNQQEIPDGNNDAREIVFNPPEPQEDLSSNKVLESLISKNIIRKTEVSSCDFSDYFLNKIYLLTASVGIYQFDGTKCIISSYFQCFNWEYKFQQNTPFPFYDTSNPVNELYFRGNQALDLIESLNFFLEKRLELEKFIPAFFLTGNPGIGKSIFINLIFLVLCNIQYPHNLCMYYYSGASTTFHCICFDEADKGGNIHITYQSDKWDSIDSESFGYKYFGEIIDPSSGGMPESCQKALLNRRIMITSSPHIVFHSSFQLDRWTFIMANSRIYNHICLAWNLFTRQQYTDDGIENNISKLVSNDETITATYEFAQYYLFYLSGGNYRIMKRIRASLLSADLKFNFNLSMINVSKVKIEDVIKKVPNFLSIAKGLFKSTVHITNDVLDGISNSIVDEEDAKKKEMSNTLFLFTSSSFLSTTRISYSFNLILLKHAYLYMMKRFTDEVKNCSSATYESFARVAFSTFSTIMLQTEKKLITLKLFKPVAPIVWTNGKNEIFDSILKHTILWKDKPNSEFPDTVFISHTTNTALVDMAILRHKTSGAIEDREIRYKKHSLLFIQFSVSSYKSHSFNIKSIVQHIFKKNFDVNKSNFSDCANIVTESVPLHDNFSTNDMKWSHLKCNTITTFGEVFDCNNDKYRNLKNKHIFPNTVIEFIYVSNTPIETVTSTNKENEPVFKIIPFGAPKVTMIRDDTDIKVIDILSSVSLIRNWYRIHYENVINKDVDMLADVEDQNDVGDQDGPEERKDNK